ncbi:hypothetical protein L5B71_01915 [Avibacterium sp. 21-586]|uniref:glycerophosphodiester phosphodiesterase family protein n=1 Tax=Avibacterium sp. 21-586 TaxID=2911534 RepID=UPI002E164E29|nr:hypothetical protein [Avibacterium sp. 21-586]
MPELSINLPLHFLIAYNEWEETQVKDPTGEWVNYDYNWVFENDAMQEISMYVDGISPEYSMLIDTKSSSYQHIVPSKLGILARKSGLNVHTYTIRKDALPHYVSSMTDLLDALVNAGANGFFTDFPDIAKQHFIQKSHLINHN